jgi:predicted MarR family transcription regulator
MKNVDKNLHLSQTNEEINITEFELQLWRVFNGFIRWVEECERNVNNTDLDGYEMSILHVIRMKDRPKSINDINRILNRTDTFNVQYSIKKLLKLGLIKKDRATLPRKRHITYCITENGIKNTEIYSFARRQILIDLFLKHDNLALGEIVKTFATINRIYSEAEQAAASYLAPNILED